MRLSAFEEHLLAEPLRIFDVGARGGIDRRWRPFGAYLETVGFEPDPTECERLNRAVASQKPAARFLPYVLAADERTVTFYEARWPAGSSIYPPNDETLRPFPLASRLFGVEQARKVEATSLDRVCSLEDLWPDHLKLDVEGAELDVLCGATRASDEALALEVEVEFAPLRQGQPLFADIDSHLRMRGWSLLGLRRVSWRRTRGLDAAGAGAGGQLIQADALYYNAVLLDSGPGLTRLLKLVLILMAYRQLDFALDLLRSEDTSLRQLPQGQVAELESAIRSRPKAIVRLLRRVSARLDDAQRRALADALQPGTATVWHDPHFF